MKGAFEWKLEGWNADQFWFFGKLFDLARLGGDAGVDVVLVHSRELVQNGSDQFSVCRMR